MRQINSLKDALCVRAECVIFLKNNQTNQTEKVKEAINTVENIDWLITKGVLQ